MQLKFAKKQTILTELIRLKEYAKDGILHTEHLFVHVLYWVDSTGFILVKQNFLVKDNINILILSLERNIQENITFKPTPLTFSLELDEKNDKLDFNDASNHLFLVEIIDENGRPTGTKRSVVTYEDTDIIDTSIATP